MVRSHWIQCVFHNQNGYSNELDMGNEEIIGVKSASFILPKESILMMGKAVAHSALVINLIWLLAPNKECWVESWGKKMKFDIKRVPVLEIIMWNWSASNYSINIGFIDGIVKHEIVRDHLENKWRSRK